jgi:hypothetical protein
MMPRWLLLACCLLLAACAGAAPRGDLDAPPALVVEAPPEPDRSCQVDADCTVKNVGNCCGYFPACVNRNAQTFPEQVKAACEREGRSSICGFQEISACQCVEQRCQPAAPTDALLR